MPSIAVTKEGIYTDAEALPSTVWEAMKAQVTTGDFLMPCCHASAVLKTSQNGVQFFAHLSDECRTAPETIWHKDGKALIVTKLAAMGIPCQEEVSGGLSPNLWEADTLFHVAERTIAIELQRSYQPLRDYLRRQARYTACGVECYWLTRPETFRTLVGSTSRLRMKREWGGKFPAGQSSFYPLLPEFPVAMLSFEDAPCIRSPGSVRHGITDWLRGIVEQRYVYEDGAWVLTLS